MAGNTSWSQEATNFMRLLSPLLRSSKPAIAGLAVLAATASIGSAAQFVLFDVTFTYTKADADNSTPSKSHFYVRGDLLNPDRPRDWTSPVDYRNGSVHIRAEVLDKPVGGAPTTWTLCYIPNRGQGNGYGCTGTGIYREEGVYEQDVSMTSWWENQSIVWTEGIKQMDLVIKDDSGGGGHAHKRADHERYFPTKMRITMIQVSAGSTYDPSWLSKPRAAAQVIGPESIASIAVNQFHSESANRVGGHVGVLPRPRFSDIAPRAGLVNLVTQLFIRRDRLR
jgi:hypothetical protein